MIDPAAAAREINRRAIVEMGAMPAVSAHILPHVPWPKQLEFLRTTEREVLYGGAASGGKSDAHLMAAAQYVHVPGYAALIIRKTYKDLALPGAIMARALQWWRGKYDIKWNDDDRCLTFPWGGTITFGYLESESDKDRYQGAEIQYLGVDEATQFPENRVRYLTSRLRRLAGSVVPIRARFSANPGGIGHDWVFNRFVAPGAPCKFIRALKADNPSVDQEEYDITLDALDPTTRAQLRDGVWIRDGGGLVYGHFSDELNLIEAAPHCENILLAYDFGVEDQNAVTVLGWQEYDPCIYILKSYRFKGIVADVKRADDALVEQYGERIVKRVGDVGGMGKLFQAELSSRYELAIEPAQKSDKVGFISLMNADLARGRIQVVRDGCMQLLDEWHSLPWDKSRLKEEPAFLNHAADSALYGWRATTAYHNEPMVVKPKPGTDEAVEEMARRLEQAATGAETENWI